MQKKFKAVAITIPFMLFMSGEQHAHPLPELLRGEADPRPVAEAVASPAVTKTDSPQRQQQSAKAASGNRKPGASRKRPRGLTRTAKRRPHQESKRSSSTAIAARRLHILKRDYARCTRQPLPITSFDRTAAEQARAIHYNLRTYGIRYVLRTYGGSSTIREIVRPYKANRRRPQQAQRKMTRVIEAQVARGVYISDHLLGRAVDIRSRGRSGARLSVLRDIARKMGGKVLVEVDHYHYKLL